MDDRESNELMETVEGLGSIAMEYGDVANPDEVNMMMVVAAITQNTKALGRIAEALETMRVSNSSPKN